MGTYGLDGVLLGWKNGTLTTEQAVGQILQLLEQLDDRVKELERASIVPKAPVKAGRRKNAHAAST